MIKAVAKKLIAQEYPHVKLPAVVYATVSKAAQLGETVPPFFRHRRGDKTGDPVAVERKIKA